MAKKYYVNLAQDERESLKRLINGGNTQGYRIRHAQILLRLDEIPENDGWIISRIAEAFHANKSSVYEVGKRYVEQGMEAALGRKVQENRRHKIDGRVEACIVATACSAPPDGCERWTLQLMADEVVRLGVVESISATAVGTTLKKMHLSHGRSKNGAYQKQEPSS
jgi:transposase